MARLAVMGIVVEGDRSVSVEMQKILTSYGDIIVGRMGIPDRDAGVSVISLILKGENEQISALSGKVGKLSGVVVKTATTSAVVD